MAEGRSARRLAARVVLAASTVAFAAMSPLLWAGTAGADSAGAEGDPGVSTQIVADPLPAYSPIASPQGELDAIESAVSNNTAVNQPAYAVETWANADESSVLEIVLLEYDGMSSGSLSTGPASTESPAQAVEAGVCGQAVTPTPVAGLANGGSAWCSIGDGGGTFPGEVIVASKGNAVEAVVSTGTDPVALAQLGAVAVHQYGNLPGSWFNSANLRWLVFGFWAFCLVVGLLSGRPLGPIEALLVAGLAFGVGFFVARQTTTYDLIRTVALGTGVAVTALAFLWIGIRIGRPRRRSADGASGGPALAYADAPSGDSYGFSARGDGFGVTPAGGGNHAPTTSLDPLSSNRNVPYGTVMSAGGLPVFGDGPIVIPGQAGRDKGGPPRVGPTAAVTVGAPKHNGRNGRNGRNGHGPGGTGTAQATTAGRPPPVGTAPTAGPAAGWYPIDGDPNHKGYWDGTGWRSYLRWDGSSWNESD